MLMPAPLRDVHGRYNEQLRALPDQFVGDSRIAQVIADADPDFAPGRVPDLLVGRG